ncbi:hypothetical protein [Methylobacterium dankookense]|uniref:Uncharacterized protein n=1 Tax=Methylobacterium dankookense TaxID=560405 RepID=A0A564FSS6_9HYPH|nr:hypothetical protein [Methylobacterium dankookense]GJD54884.1 hypothetical protein IFDJLNFL_0763 [Methylobacterium dankookense]VUF11102.1 hypothetical protein MTDSW087_00775 [Methylobacterium dankookense]
MPRALDLRRSRHLLAQAPLRHRAHGPEPRPVRTSDLVLALLSVVMLGGLALAAAFALTAGTAAP